MDWKNPLDAFKEPPKPRPETVTERLERQQRAGARPVTPIEDPSKQPGGTPTFLEFNVNVPSSGSVNLNADEGMFDTVFIVASDSDANNGYDTTLWKLRADGMTVARVTSGVKVHVPGVRRFTISSTGAFAGAVRGFLWRAMDYGLTLPWCAGLSSAGQLRAHHMTDQNELLVAVNAQATDQNDLWMISENSSFTQGNVANNATAANVVVVSNPGGRKLIVTDCTLYCQAAAAPVGIVLANYHFSGSALILWSQVLNPGVIQQQHNFGLTGPVSAAGASLQVDVTNAAADPVVILARCRYF